LSVSCVTAVGTDAFVVLVGILTGKLLALIATLEAARAERVETSQPACR